MPFGTTDLSVSPLGLGAMNFGSAGWGCDEREAADILRIYRDAGGNFVDTANIYAGGESERILGRLIAGSRQDIVLASKVGFPAPGSRGGGLSPATIRPAIEGTLERLRTDFLDLYQLHCYDPTVPLADTLGAMQSLVDAGLIRYAGCSNFFAWQIAHGQAIAQTHGLGGIASAQMMYNLVRRDIEREHIGYARESGLALIAYSPLHGGQLASAWRSRAELPADSRAVASPDVYLSDESRVFEVTDALIAHARQAGTTPGQLALGWVLRNAAVTTTLIAARSANELLEQLVVLDLEVDPSIWASLDLATALPSSYPSDFYERINERA